MGILLLGFFGGLISSVAVIADLSTLTKTQEKFHKLLCASAILTTVGSLVVVAAILLAAAPQLLYIISWPLFIMILVGTGLALLIISQNGANGHKEVYKNHQNPLQVKAIINLAIILALMIAFVAIAQHTFDSHATVIIAFLAGLVDLRSISLAIATLFRANQ